MSKLIATDYGLRAAHEQTAAPADARFDPQAVDAMMDELLLRLPSDVSISSDFKFSFNDQTITAHDVLKAMSTQLPRIRAGAIERFERYFAQGTDIDRLVRDYGSGGAEARRTVRHMGIFPLEALSVREEIAFPRLIQINAARGPNEHTGYHTIAAILGNRALVQLQGPHLPPMPPETTIRMLQDYVPILDRHTQDFLNGHTQSPTPRPSGMN